MMKKLNNEKYWKSFFNEFTKETKALMKNKGFTYGIPKEEQIRSALYSFLKKDFPLIEIESNLSKNNKIIAEYDLRIISKKLDLLIEIKRAWSLKNWNNKYSEYIRDWKKDIEKLQNSDKQNYFNSIIKKNHKKCFLLVTFSNNEESLRKYKIKELDSFIKEKWKNVFNLNSNKEMISEKIYINFFVWINI